MRHVELNDEGAARSAAAALTALGGRLREIPEPPPVTWSGDKFSNAIRASYLMSNGGGTPLPDTCVSSARELGEWLADVGDATRNAVAGLGNQDDRNTEDMNRVVSPNV